MPDDRKAGIALIAGSLGGILTMAIHPAGTSSMSAEQIARLSIISGAAHSIAIVSIIALFLGACGLTRSISAADRIAFAGLVTYGFACVAVLVAASVSGFVMPGIMKHMVRDIPGAAHQWQIVMDAIFQINQAFARIYSVTASIAIIFWSASALRNTGLSRGVAVYGCIISALIISGIGSGHWRLDIHWMAALWLGQATWFIIVGSQLWSRAASSVPQH